MQTNDSSPVIIAPVRAHGVRQLLVYCNGKREGDWPCHHSGKLPIEQRRGNAVNDIVPMTVHDLRLAAR